MHFRTGRNTDKVQEFMHQAISLHKCSKKKYEIIDIEVSQSPHMTVEDEEIVNVIC